MTFPFPHIVRGGIPAIRDVSLGELPSGTPKAIPLPQYSSGDLLLITVTRRNNSAWALPVGWGEVFSRSTAGGVGFQLVCFGKKAEASDGASAEFTTSNNAGLYATMSVKSVSNYEGIAGASMTPPPLAPSFGPATLWVAFGGRSGYFLMPASITTAPPGYGGFQTMATSGTSNIALGTGFLEHVSNSESPGAFESDGDTYYGSGLVGIA